MFLHFSHCVLFGGQALAVDHRNQGGAIVVHCGRPLVLTGAFGWHFWATLAQVKRAAFHR